MGEITPRIAGHRLVFDVDYGDTNGIYRFSISDFLTKDTIWDVRLCYYYDNAFLYGEVPRDFQTFNGLTHSAEQVYPQKQTPPTKLLNGRIYKTYSRWQYDQWFTPCISSTVQYFVIETDVVIILSYEDAMAYVKKSVACPN